MKNVCESLCVFVHITAAIESLPFPPPFGKCISFYRAIDFVPSCAIYFLKNIILHEVLPKTLSSDL